VIDLLYTGVVAFVGAASDYVYKESAFWYMVGTHAASIAGAYYFRDYALLALQAHMEEKEYQTID